jgi:capsular polysaccharide biosynthesis protein
VDLNEAVRRIFLVHRKLIILCAVLGLIGGLAVTAARPSEFTAATRLTLGGQGAGTTEDAVAVADAAEALVTSRAIVERAVQKVGLDRDPLEVAKDAISVKTLGSSELVQLEVTDMRPTVASDLANALGQELVDRWADVSGGRSIDALVPLQEEIGRVRDDLAAADQQLALYEIEIARETRPVRVQRLEAKRDVLAQDRDDLERRRMLLESQLNGVLVQGASEQVPQVIDPAVPPAQADPKHQESTAALGAFLGLLVGICVAALVESLRPTLAGSAAIADALGVPMLGKMPTDDEGPAEEILRPALKARLAATGARAKTVELVSIGPWIDLSRLSDAMEDLDAAAAPDGPPALSANGRLTVRRFGADLALPTRSNGANADVEIALVAVMPSTIKRSALRELDDLQALTSWPLVGVVTYDRTMGMGRRPRPGLRTRPADEGTLDLSQRAG